MVDVSPSQSVAAVAAYGIEDLENPLGLLIPSEKGLFFRSYTPETPGELKKYLAIRAGREVFHIHRESDKNGRIILRKKKPQSGSLGYCAALASALTAHPYNEQHFVFRVVQTTSEIFDGAVLVAGAECQCDLFLPAHERAASWRCQCGAALTFKAKRCLRCHAWNPLFDGAFLTAASDRWKCVADDALSLIKAAQSRCTTLCGALESIKQLILDGPKIPDDADEKERARLLLAFYNVIFAPAAVDRCLLNDFSKYPALTVAGYLTQLGTTAARMRAEWRLGAIAGWAPSADFRKELSNRVKEIWSEPIEKTREGLLALAKAAVCYKPFAQRYQSVVNMGPLEEFWRYVVRPVLTVVSTIGSAGLSLALKAGLFVIKSATEARQYEIFSNALGDAAQRILAACESIQTAINREKELRATLASGLAAHLANLAAHDFSLEPPNGKVILVNRIRATVGIRPSFPPEKRGNFLSRPLAFWLLAVVFILAMVLLFFALR